MKNVVIICSLFFMVSCSTTQKINYITISNAKEKTLQGVINRNIIASDTSFKWFKNNYNHANPNANAVEVFRTRKNDFSLMVFGGTWCEDTQNLLPLFYKLIDKSEYPEKKITLVGVNREKKSGNELSTIYSIINVPTFIVLNKKGKEVGRVVEYGKYNEIDKELAEIVSSIQ